MRVINSVPPVDAAGVEHPVQHTPTSSEWSQTALLLENWQSCNFVSAPVHDKELIQIGQSLLPMLTPVSRPGSQVPDTRPSRRRYQQPSSQTVPDQTHENPVEAAPQHVEGVQCADAEVQAAFGVQGGLGIIGGTVESEMQIHTHTHTHSHAHAQTHTLARSHAHVLLASKPRATIPPNRAACVPRALRAACNDQPPSRAACALLATSPPNRTARHGLCSARLACGL